MTMTDSDISNVSSSLEQEASILGCNLSLSSQEDL